MASARNQFRFHTGGRQAVSIFIDTLLHRHERGSSVMRCRGHGARFIYNRAALRRDARVEYYARVLTRRPHAATDREGVYLRDREKG